MSRIAAIALFSLATVMTSSSASAQIMKVVPFDFTVNNNSLPAGTYTFGFDSVVPGLLIIQDRMKSVKAADLGVRGLIGPGKPHTLIFQDLPKQPPPPNQCATLRESNEHRPGGKQRRFSLYFEVLAGVFLSRTLSWAMMSSIVTNSADRVLWFAQHFILHKKHRHPPEMMVTSE